MLRHRILDLVPDKVFGRAIDWYWPRREAEFSVIEQAVAPGSVAIDIGTWWGPWTSALSQRAATVHAFEPQPRLAEALRRRAADNVVVHQVALSDHAGTASLWMPKASRGLDALASIRDQRSSIELEREGTIEEVDVEIAPLDSFGITDVSFIKVDVEGHELEVLGGARQTIEQQSPTVLIEIEQRHHDEPIDRVFEWFVERGYRGWFLQRDVWQSVDQFEVDRDQLDQLHRVNSEAYVNNFLFSADRTIAGNERQIWL